MFNEIEIFSSLESDKPTRGNRSFASNLGELVLVTEYPCANGDEGDLVLKKLLRAVEPLDGTINFEFRGAVPADFGGIRNVILYPEGGFLSSLIHSDVNLGWCFRIKVAVDICRGLLALHDSDRIHNDLRPGNLGLDSEWRCKFLELICVETVTDIYSPHPLSPGVRGDERYLAPEIIRNAACTAASDMYSFGLVLFELCARVPVHVVPRDPETMSVPVDDLLESLSDSTPSSLVELMRQLLNDEAEYRPSVEDALDWLDSLLMETSPQNDPPDPPLPPLPFLQKRNSARRSGQSMRGLSGGGQVVISPSNALRLREIADSAAQRAEGGASPQGGVGGRDWPLVSSQSSIAEENEGLGELKSLQPGTATLGLNTIVGKPFMSSESRELKGYVQLKAHNLPIHKNKYFFFKDGHLVWCSDKKLRERPERLHYFDLTHARLDETQSHGLTLCLVKIDEEGASSGKVAEPKKNFFASSSKEREKLNLKFSSVDDADMWRQLIKEEMTRSRCQMCKCRVELSSEQAFQRDRYRLLMEDSAPDQPQTFDDLSVYCSEPCFRFKSRVASKGLGVSVTVSGSPRLCQADTEVMKIDKNLVSKRNPAAWRRMSRKYGLSHQKGLPQIVTKELPPNMDSWLAALNLSDLCDVFKDRGYVEILHIMIASLSDEDMDYLGIMSKDSRRALMSGADTLRNDYVNNMKAVSISRDIEMIC